MLFTIQYALLWESNMQTLPFFPIPLRLFTENTFIYRSSRPSQPIQHVHMGLLHAQDHNCKFWHQHKKMLFVQQ